MAVPGCQIQAGGAHCRRRGAGRLERLAEERILGSRPVWPYAGVLRVVKVSQLCCAGCELSQEGRRWSPPGIENGQRAVILRLFILFTVVPLVELWLFLQIAAWTSTLFTILVVVFTGVLGTIMTRSQGLRALQNLKQQIATRRGVTDAILDAVMILVAGVLLITPGVLTDAFGFSLLIPWCRRWYRTLVAARIARRFQVSEMPRQGGPSGANSRVIDSYVVPRQDELDQQG